MNLLDLPGPDIAVVGGAAAAVCLLRALAESKLVDGYLTVFEPTSLRWRGRAYQHDAEHVRTNALPEDISVTAADPDDFTHWLIERSLFDPATETLPDGAHCPPRRRYGEYLEDRAAGAIRSLRARGWRVRLVEERVVDAERAGGRVWLRTDSGQISGHGHVVLCVGSDGAHDPYRLAGRTGFIGDVYPIQSTLDRVPAGASTAVLGNGLTAVDAVLGLAANGHTGPITMVSRSGILPGVRQHPVRGLPVLADRIWRRQLAEGTPVSWARAANWLSAELGRAGADLGRLQREMAAVGTAEPWARLRRNLGEVDDPDPALRMLQAAVPFAGPRLWASLAEGDRGHLLDNAFRTIVSLCCPMTPASATALLGLAESGQLRLRAGVREVIPITRGGFEVRTADSRLLRVDRVINACGAAPGRVPTAALPLISSLTSAGRARPHPHGGLRVDPRTSAVLGADGPDPRLFVLGDLGLGTFLFTFGIPALVERAVEIVRALGSHHRSLFPARADGRPHLLGRK
ncbi:FAD/NAD(P)-binding protein [Crossiella cryophila]|uniref:Putative NAD(P)/FAD-binding protein YdhS n=1 Tax=Crossiella cryophila TaxID=43355 RepID=A0A7W7CGY9_9PSEU|nr:FAD/NAD(P)-binding protein [Crossiella cryophila]MBB4679606.1 putative NAD(P)/FAD-binding protein YdhS [Crossiella cryophila]